MEIGKGKKWFFWEKILCLLSFVGVLALSMPVEVKGEIPYQWKDVYVGALDAENLAGLLLAPHPGCAFSFKIRVQKQDNAVEGIDQLFLISDVGPQSPDGQYARIEMDLGLPFGKEGDTPILKKPSKKQTTLVMEWSRQSEKIVIGKIFVPAGMA